MKICSPAEIPINNLKPLKIQTPRERVIQWSHHIMDGAMAEAESTNTPVHDSLLSATLDKIDIFATRLKYLGAHPKDFDPAIEHPILERASSLGRMMRSFGFLD